MPQMAPINWLSMYFIFIFIFMLFNMKNFFLFYYLPKTSKKFSKKNILTWKW